MPGLQFRDDGCMVSGRHPGKEHERGGWRDGIAQEVGPQHPAALSWDQDPEPLVGVELDHHALKTRIGHIIEGRDFDMNERDAVIIFKRRKRDNERKEGRERKRERGRKERERKISVGAGSRTKPEA